MSPRSASDRIWLHLAKNRLLLILLAKQQLVVSSYNRICIDSSYKSYSTRKVKGFFPYFFIKIIKASYHHDNFRFMILMRTWSHYTETCACSKVSDQSAHLASLIAQSNQSSLGTLLIAKNPKFLPEDNNDWSDCTDVQDDLSIFMEK